MYLSVRIHHMGHNGFDVANGTMLRAYYIAVAHESDMLAIYTDNPMNHIATALYPSQHHIAHVYKACPFQDDAFTTTNDKGQHAVAIHGQRHADTFPHQPDGLL